MNAPVKAYNFRKGKKNPRWDILHNRITFKNSVEGMFMIPCEAMYDPEPSDGHLNKVIRLSNDIHHHVNSVGIGWRPKIINKYRPIIIELFLYIYDDCNFIAEPLIEINPHQVINYRIILHKHHYQIQLTCNMRGLVLCNRKYVHGGSNFPFHYLLKPEHEDDLKAPHDYWMLLSTKFYNTQNIRQMKKPMSDMNKVRIALAGLFTLALVAFIFLKQKEKNDPNYDQYIDNPMSALAFMVFCVVVWLISEFVNWIKSK